MKARQIIAILITLAILLVLAGAYNIYKSNQGTVALNYNVTDTSSVHVAFNDKVVKQVSTNTFKLHSGSYSVAVSQTGYKTFSASVNVTKGESLLVNVNLQPASDSTINSIDQLNIPGVSSSIASITSTTYFYNKTWAVVGIQTSDGDAAVVIVAYNIGTASWQTIYGPGTLFSQSDTAKLPTAVQSYLSSKEFVAGGGSS